MSNEAPTSNAAPAAARLLARRLRYAALGVLLVGLFSAVAIYALNKPPVVSDDPATIGEDKPGAIETGRMYGGLGLLEQDLADDLQQPATQAVVVGAAATLVAGGFFVAAHWLNGGRVP